MSIRSFFMAKFYDASIKKMEEQCLGNWRRELLSQISGDILEIGSGTGVNLSYYPKSVGSLTLTEPDSHMRKILQDNVNNEPDAKIRVEGFSAEELVGRLLCERP